jgi:hypothetical protein
MNIFCGQNSTLNIAGGAARSPIEEEIQYRIALGNKAY